jgi:type II secretory pathway component GspD/PulD (secretin)
MNVVTMLALAVMGGHSHVPTASPGQPAAGAKPEPQAAAQASVESILCSINAAQMDVATILQKLSESTKTNLMLLGTPGTKVTLNLANVPLIDMIRHLCALSGLSYMKIGGTYVLASQEQLLKSYPEEWAKQNPAEWDKLHPKAEPVPPAPEVFTETYRLSHVSGGQIAQAMKSIFGEGKGPTVVAGPAPLSPSITDQSTSATTGTGSNVLKAEVATDGGGKTLIIRGTRTEIDDVIRLIKQLDTPRAQVSIAVAIYDISNDAMKDLGLNWSFGNVTISEQSPDKLNFGSFSRTPLTFSTQISALEKAQKAKILAAPNVSVLDGERAFILIGERLNFPVLVGYTQNNAPIFDKQQERVGIYLQVAANVSNDNSITLSLYPQVSTVTGFLQINGASYPQISTREAQTTLRLKSGETFVMGGLFKDEEIRLIERVPILSQIPLLGELFKHRKTTKNASQVMISITPIVLPATPNEPR